MDFNAILELFRKLTELNAADSAQWEYLINDSVYEIYAMLLPDCDVETNCHRLTAVAAALAFYRYKSIMAARNDASGFKAGDVTVNFSSEAVENAKRLYIDRLSGIGDLLKVNDFVFGGVDSLCS